MQVSPVVWVEMQRSSCCIKTRELLPHICLWNRPKVRCGFKSRFSKWNTFKWKPCLTPQCKHSHHFSLSFLPADSDLDLGTAGCICWRYRLAHLLATCLSPPWSCIRAAALWSAGLCRKKRWVDLVPVRKKLTIWQEAQVELRSWPNAWMRRVAAFLLRMTLSCLWSRSSVWDFLCTKSSKSKAECCGHSLRPLFLNLPRYGRNARVYLSLLQWSAWPSSAPHA